MTTIYKYPSFYNQNINYDILTQDQINLWIKEIEDIEKYNQDIYKAQYAKYKEVLTLAVNIWGKSNKVVKYLEKQTPPSRPNFSVNYIQNEFDKRTQEKENKIKEEQNKLASDKYLTECYAYCVKHNLSCEPQGLIERAEEHAYKARCHEWISRGQNRSEERRVGKECRL